MGVCHSLGAYSSLIDDIHFPHNLVDVRRQFVVHAMFIEVAEDIWPHLQLGRADEKYLHAIKLCQEIGEGTSSASFIKFSNDGDTQTIQGALPVDGVKIKQGLGRMLSPIAVSSVDDGHGRNVGGAMGTALLVMAYHDYIAITAHDAD